MSTARERVKLLERLACSGAFLAFVGAVELRIDGGRFEDALEMLKDAGAQPVVAWEILDGWPTNATKPYKTRQAEAAVRLAHYIPMFDRYDWPTMLKRALREEVARKHHPALQ